MAGFLRFTRDEYESITQASAALPASDSSLAFQRGLAGALQERHPDLAERIAGLCPQKVRLIWEHLLAQTLPAVPAADAHETGEAGYGLSYREWRIVSHACSLLFLFADTPVLCKEALLRKVGEEAPELAEKLSSLSEERVVSLYRRAKSGRRWCP